MPFNYNYYRTIQRPNLNTLSKCIQEGFDDFIYASENSHCFCFFTYNEKAINQAREFKQNLVDLLIRINHGIETLDANNLPRRIYGRALAASSPRTVAQQTDDTITVSDIFNSTLDYITEQLEKNAKHCSSQRLRQRIEQIKTCSQHICKALKMDTHELRLNMTTTLSYSSVATLSFSQDNMSTATLIEP